MPSELLTALCTSAGERLEANEPWRDVFGDDGLWSRLPVEDVRFAADAVVEAARGQAVTHQVFLVERADRAEVTPVLLHVLPVRLPDVDAGRYPVQLLAEVLREPAAWAAEQTRRRRLEVLGRMTMGIAHDFNNLLTTVLGHAELLGTDLARMAVACPPEATGDAPAHLRTLVRAAQDGAALVRKIQQYIRNDRRERAEAVLLHDLAAEVLALTKPYWHNEPRRRGIAIEVEADLREVPPILGTPTELREVLVNLVLNAVQAMPAGGLLRLATYALGERAAAVDVADTGVGMSERVRARIFEPLFTTKGEAGTGMGLSVSQGIVQEHNGRIDVESAPGQGTCFRLVFPFPASDEALPRAAEPESAPAAPQPGLRLLVVDDEPLVRLVTTKLLRMRGHAVTDTDGGAAALAALEAAGPGGFDLMITDLSMPGMSGRELASETRRRAPGLPVVLLTGDTDAEAEAEDIAAVVAKPFQIDALDAVVRRVVAG